MIFMETSLAIDRIYFTGCWDSNGHEEIRTRRYHCVSESDARSLYRNLLSLPNTKAVKVLRFNRYRNCFEVFHVSTPRSPGEDDDCELTLPAGSKDRSTVQSTLFRPDGEVIS